MTAKSLHSKNPAEQVVKSIRRATRRQFSTEDKIRIVLHGQSGEDSISGQKNSVKLEAAKRPGPHRQQR